jgi:DNA-binding transcriptional regulator YiaG
MGPARTYIPNLRLQWHRHRLRLTQEQVAEQIALIAWERFAVRVGVDARMVSKWERGEKRPSRLYQECLRLLFNDPELFGAGDDAMNRRQWLRGTAAVGTAMLLESTGASPEENAVRSEDRTVEKMLADATAESVELSRQTEASDLGPATLEHLELAVERLGLVYLNTPPPLLLNELRWYRRRAKEVLGGRHTLAQRRRLYVAAGWLTGLLGHLAFDLGDYQASPGALRHGLAARRRRQRAGACCLGEEHPGDGGPVHPPVPGGRALCRGGRRPCRRWNDGQCAAASARRTSSRPAWQPTRDGSGHSRSRAGV